MPSSRRKSNDLKAPSPEESDGIASGELTADEFLSLDRSKRRWMTVLSPVFMKAVTDARESSQAGVVGLGEAAGQAVAAGRIATQKRRKKGIDAGGLAVGAYWLTEYARYRRRLRRYRVPGAILNAEEARKIAIHSERKEDAFYVCHPLQDVYLAPADFHTYVFLSKVSEASRIFGLLGATSAEVVSRKVNGKSLSAKVKIPDLADGVSAGGAAGAEQEKLLSATRKLKWEGFDQPRLDPGDFPEEFPWYASDPTLQDLFEQRSVNRLTEVECSVEYKESSIVDAGVSAQAEGLELDLGGKFKKSLDVTYTYKVLFPGSVS